ncbi:AsnC family transcriptional regulator [Streptacidiphilus cavernicola]|uniref:AsnC family transcriptional regulator n=1 Tax=Streptacidiphilus cavernicola TaxID=3342716 RepID=A0ABV6VPB2_9ACTN
MELSSAAGSRGRGTGCRRPAGCVRAGSRRNWPSRCPRARRTGATPVTGLLRGHRPASGHRPGPADSALFAALAQDGRAGQAELAAATGWAPGTVARRLAELRASGALFFDVEIDPALLGGVTAALHRYLVGRIGALDAIHALETAPVLRTVKSSGPSAGRGPRA